MAQNCGVPRHQEPVWPGQSQRGRAACCRHFTAELLGFGLRDQGVERTFLGFTPLLKLKNSLAQPEMWRDLDKEVCSQHEH